MPTLPSDRIIHPGQSSPLSTFLDAFLDLPLSVSLDSSLTFSGRWHQRDYLRRSLCFAVSETSGQWLQTPGNGPQDFLEENDRCSIPALNESEKTHQFMMKLKL